MAGQPAPELELAVDLERLAPEPQLKAHALLAHPQPGRVAPGDQDLGQVGVAAVFGEPPDIVVILLLGVGPDIDSGEFVVADVGDEAGQVVEPVIDDAPRPAGKRRIAAAPVLGRNLQHQHRGAALLRRQRRASRRIAGADDDHIMLGDVHPFTLHRPSRRKPGPIVVQHPPISELVRGRCGIRKGCCRGTMGPGFRRDDAMEGSER